MFSWILYYLFRVIARFYLYFTNTARNWKVLQNSWESNDVKFEKYRIQNEGHVRFFVFVNSYNLEEDLDWHKIIHLSDSILACTMNIVRNEKKQIDITDIVKEFSHYIYSNPFITFDDLFTLFNIETGDYYNLMIIFDDLSEKECVVKGEDSLQKVFKKPQDLIEQVPFM